MCYAQFSRLSENQRHHFGAFGPHFRPFSRHFRSFGASAPVNVSESKEAFKISLFAPGLDKMAFQISVTDEVLRVRYDGPPTIATTDRQVHQEHPIEPFERRFMLNGHVETALITAQYREGVLEINLPKKADAVGQDIPVA